MTSHGIEDKNTSPTVEDLAMGLQIVESDDLLDNIEDAIENRSDSCTGHVSGRCFEDILYLQRRLVRPFRSSQTTRPAAT